MRWINTVLKHGSGGISMQVIYMHYINGPSLLMHEQVNSSLVL